MRRNLHLLTSAGFLLGLAVLLANDFLLKPLFHNWLTGKLSDFAGLFIFPLFLTALAARHKRAIYLLVPLAFLFWKSAYAQPLIDFWNGVTPLTLARQRDASDLLALVALIPSYKYHSKLSSRAAQPHSQQFNRGWAGCLVAILSVFAFTATSYHTKYDYSDQEFVFADSKAGLIKRFDRFPHKIYPGNAWGNRGNADEYSLFIKTDFCFGQIDALVEIKEQDAGHSRLILRRLEHSCPGNEGDREKMLSIFGQEIVERLQNDIDAHPTALPTPKAKRSVSGAFVN